VSQVSGGVQSLTRAFDLLETLADEGGALGISELASRSGLPLPTIHRLIRSLVDGGYVRQEASRRYTLGPGLVRLGEMAGRSLGSWAKPYLAELVALTGETANLAMLEGDEVVYVAQVPSPHAMRMFTEVGRRVMPHCTGVGKALLSRLDDAEALGVVRRTGLPARTEHTITSEEALLPELELVRRRGYAVDDAEQEVGVRCVAVPVEVAQLRVAISVSGPTARVTDERVAEIAPALQRVASRLATHQRSA
jgi:IclR family transcriptional regulator, acetate operon repressor